MKRGWFRISLVAIVVWLMISFLVVLQSRDLDWWDYRGPEEGFWIFVVGALAIFVICNGIPWVADAFGAQGTTNPSHLSGSGQRTSSERPLAETGKQGEAPGLDHDAGALNLGVMYAKGLGVPQDYGRAHMWFNLAAANGSTNAAREPRHGDESQMTPQQIAEAQRMAREWVEQRKGK